jgi:2-polyprenyl-6-methoxyphenol hydroxylase-like FAD-dependent oxidoreductase
MGRLLLAGRTFGPGAAHACHAPVARVRMGEGGSMPQVIVVGAGPAGAALAFLLADRGVPVTLVERQRDFGREFRGEMLMPSGVEALERMGLAETLQSAPHWQPLSLTVFLNREVVVDVPLDPAFFGGHPPTAVSQPGLLEAIVAEAAKRPAFRFLRGTAVRDLLREGDRVVGVRVEGDAGSEALRGDLVVGTDGRASIVRRRGGFAARQNAPPMDIVWAKLPPLAGFRGARGYAGGGHLLLVYHTYGDRLQVGWAILKGTFGELRRRGVVEWVEEMAGHVTPDLAAHLRAHAAELTHPFLLDAVSDRVERWSSPGALLLGDAAHTSSPVGGQGLNLALRDAIVAANHLVPALQSGGADDLSSACARIEAERLPEIEAVQRAQALPPRVLLSRRWWGEPARRLVARLARSRLGRRLALSQARLFAFGAREVRLEV